MLNFQSVFWHLGLCLTFSLARFDTDFQLTFLFDSLNFGAPTNKFFAIYSLQESHVEALDQFKLFKPKVEGERW